MLMVRSARNDFEALLTGEAMESVGAVVISISYDGEHKLVGALESSSRFVVWARVADNAMIDKVDLAIEKALDG